MAFKNQKENPLLKPEIQPKLAEQNEKTIKQCPFGAKLYKENIQGKTYFKKTGLSLTAIKNY